jgi:Pao retrotransposon peptidase
MRRVVWRYGDDESKVKVFITTTVNFGDRPAGCIAIAAVLFGEGKPEAQWFIQNRTYVDDCMAGDNDYKKLLKISRDLDELVEQGGFKFKETHISGDKMEDDIPRKVLGVFWNTGLDTLMLDIKINFSGKRKGAKLAPDVDLEEEDIDEVTPEVVTKRMVWRVAQAQYDPLGLVSPFMIQFKLVMRSLCSEEGKVTGWDESIPDSVVVAFKKAMSGLRQLRNISFLRTIQPGRRPVEPPLLLMFGDGSREAYATLAYIRWVLEEGSIECKLISGKSRVEPKTEDFYSKDGADGCFAGCQVGQEDQGFLHIQVQGVLH